MDDDKKQDNAQSRKPAARPVADTGDKDDKEPDPAGLDPTRFGDWEKNGRCIDF